LFEFTTTLDDEQPALLIVSSNMVMLAVCSSGSQNDMVVLTVSLTDSVPHKDLPANSY